MCRGACVGTRKPDLTMLAALAMLFQVVLSLPAPSSCTVLSSGGGGCGICPWP
jgi:hypothetical protein